MTVRLLIDYNIDINIWDCWDCVLSVIDSVRSVDASFPYVVSMLHLCQCYLLQMLPSVDIFLHRYMGFLGLCSVCYCVRPYLFVPPPLLFMRLYLLSAPHINASVLCPVDTSPFISIIPSINAFVF